jgi:lipid-A-disaccharide synthase
MDDTIVILDEQDYGCLSQSELVLTCSGTATLELALLGVPMIVAYRLDPLSHWLARRLSMTPYVAMPNVLMEDWVVPEIIQHRITGEHFAAQARRLLNHHNQATAMRQHLAEVRKHLGSPGALDRAAARILEETEASMVLS